MCGRSYPVCAVDRNPLRQEALERFHLSAACSLNELFLFFHVRQQPGVENSRSVARYLFYTHKILYASSLENSCTCLCARGSWQSRHVQCIPLLQPLLGQTFDKVLERLGPTTEIGAENLRI